MGSTVLSVTHDVTPAMLMFQNHGTAAMLSRYQTNPVGVQLFSCVNTFFCFNTFACMLATWV